MARSRGSVRSRLELPASIYKLEDRLSVAGLPVRTRDLSHTGIAVTLDAPGADRPPRWPLLGQPIRVAMNDTFEGHPIVRQWMGQVARIQAEVDGACIHFGIVFEWPDGPSARPRLECPVPPDPPSAADRDQSLNDERERLAAIANPWAWTAALAGFAVDQLTKAWAASADVGLEGQVDLLRDLLAVAPRENAGAMASLAADYPLTGPICALACLALVGFSAWRGRRAGPIGGLSVGLLAAGMLGNSADRLALGHVRDFLVSPWFPSWVFNLADIFIVLGAAGWLGTQLVDHHRRLLFSPKAGTSLDARRSV